jgi:hypothetical protein
LSIHTQAVTDLNALLLRSPAAARAEHISLASEPEPTAAPPVHHRAVCANFTLAAPLCDSAMRISILEDHFVAVHNARAHDSPLDYMLDLRFANPKPRRVRHIAWSWLASTLSLAAFASLALWSAAAPIAVFLQSPGFGIALMCVLGMLGTLLRFMRATTEAVQFLSEHGEAVLIDIRGGLGSTRRGQRFFVELIRNIRAAKQARPQPKREWLRDEMREHHRLRELQVLSEESYEASKARILKAHC